MGMKEVSTKTIRILMNCNLCCCKNLKLKRNEILVREGKMLDCICDLLVPGLEQLLQCYDRQCCLKKKNHCHLTQWSPRQSRAKPKEKVNVFSGDLSVRMFCLFLFCLGKINCFQKFHIYYDQFPLNDS